MKNSNKKMVMMKKPHLSIGSTLNALSMKTQLPRKLKKRLKRIDLKLWRKQKKRRRKKKMMRTKMKMKTKTKMMTKMMMRMRMMKMKMMRTKNQKRRITRRMIRRSPKRNDLLIYENIIYFINYFIKL